MVTRRKQKRKYAREDSWTSGNFKLNNSPRLVFFLSRLTCALCMSKITMRTTTLGLNKACEAYSVSRLFRVSMTSLSRFFHKTGPLLNRALPNENATLSKVPFLTCLGFPNTSPTLLVPHFQYPSYPGGMHPSQDILCFERTWESGSLQNLKFEIRETRVFGAMEQDDRICALKKVFQWGCWLRAKKDFLDCLTFSVGFASSL